MNQRECDVKKWVNGVIVPWKHDDTLQRRTIVGIPDAQWHDLKTQSHPIHFSPELGLYEYCIKPRVVKYIIECVESYINPQSFRDIADLMDHNLWNADAVAAIRNAKPYVRQLHEKPK